MFLERALAYLALALALAAMDRWLGRRDRRVGGPVEALTGQLMSMATVATVGGGLLAAAALRSAAIGPEWVSLGLGPAVGLAGLLLRAAAVRSLGVSYTVHLGVRSGQRLVTSGPYRIVRHPGYSGILLVLLGLQLIAGSWASLASMLFVIVALPVRIGVEEAMLATHFGSQYGDYCERTTRRLVPGLL